MSSAGEVFVYIIRSQSDASQRYIGRSRDVARRLEWHNHGPDGHTRRYRPWTIELSIEFSDEKTAARFERYLKSGSGRAFAKRHFAVRADRFS